MNSRFILILASILLLTCHIEAQVAQMNLLSNWQKEGLVGSSAFNNTYNEIWGMAVNGSEYAIIGSTAGTHILNIDDPTNPDEKFFIPGADNGPVIIHRDYHDNQGFLYAVADEGQSTMQIIDMRSLPDTVTVVYDSKEFIRRSHNIFIDSSSHVLYSCISGGDDVGSFVPLRLFDVSRPDTIVPIKVFSAVEAFTFSQVHDAYVQNDTAYLNCGPGGFAIADFSSVENPTLIAGIRTSEYEQSGYNHSGWLSEDGKNYFMADENHGLDIKVLDLNNLPDIRIDTTISSEGPDFTIPHNQVVYGDYLYSSYYYEGLQVWDISNPQNIIRVAEYDTYDPIPTNPSFEGAWGVYPFLPSGNILVSDMQTGLYIFEGLETLVSNDDLDIPTFKLNIFPNPSTDYINIESDIPLLKYQLTSTQGKLVGYGKIIDAKIDLKHYPAGHYLLSLFDDKGLLRTKPISKL